MSIFAQASIMVSAGFLGALGVLIRALHQLLAERRTAPFRSSLRVTITDRAGKETRIEAKGADAEAAARLIQDALTDLDHEDSIPPGRRSATA
jgi:aspartate-semialdehyde dehydrogenase